MTYPTLTIRPAFPVTTVELRSVLQERPEDVIARSREETDSPRTTRRWHISIPLLPRVERDSLKATFVAARGDAGGVLWTPPGERTPVAVRFDTNRLQFTDTNAILSSVEFDLVQLANPTE